MSIEYYNQHAKQFYDSTVDVDMQDLYAPFLTLLPKETLILDAGCGSGRDSKAFLENGFQVEAFDASPVLVKKAKALTQIDVQVKRFNEVTERQHYDGIWACASLLHVPEKELVNVMQGLSYALKPEGIWYASFKYGPTEREKEGRLFTDMNEERFATIIKQLPDLTIHSQWITQDQRPDRDEAWFNVLLTKKL